MAAPSYTTDLQNITLAEDITNWSALGGGAAGIAAGPDLAMQGSNCIDKPVTAAEKGHIYNFGSTISTGVANRHFFVWGFLATPGLSNTLQNRGLGIVLGTSATAYNTFHIEGSDTYGAAGRVGRCYPILYNTGANASFPYRTLTSTPGANPQYFGATTNITGTVKGSNLGIDAIRYGSSLCLVSGDSTTPATLTGAAFVNDVNQNRWGILTSVGGVLELQGKLLIGQNTGGSPIQTYFQDSNRTLSIVDTPHTSPNFTQIIIDHPSTFFKIQSITSFSLGTGNPGQLIFKNNTTTGQLLSSSFSNLGITNLGSGVSCTGCTWRSSQNIIQSGAVLDACIFDQSNAISAIISNNPQKITNCKFVSRGTGHGIQIIQSGTYQFDGNIFTSYATGSGSLGAEAVYNTSSGLVVLNVLNALSPSIRNDAFSSTIVNNNIPITLVGMKDNTEARVYLAGTQTEVDGIETVVDGSSNNRSWTFSTTAGQNVDIVAHHTGYQYLRINSYVIPSSATSLPVSQQIDRVYSNL
mgnify:FL=1